MLECKFNSGPVPAMPYLRLVPRTAMVFALCVGLLGGCAVFAPDPGSSQPATQRPMRQDCKNDAEILVKFTRHKDVDEVAAAFAAACISERDVNCSISAYRMSQRGNQAAAFSIVRANHTGELHYVHPADFNDVYHLALIGHEALHLCGASH